MAVPSDRPDDEHLQQLLAIESRLQALVRAAKDEASRRVAAAAVAADARRTAALTAAEALDADQARADRAQHEQALSALTATYRQARAAIEGVPDSRLDDLAEWAVVQTLGEMEGAS